MLKKIFKDICVFFTALVICFAALILVCLIPQSAIKENCLKAAEYFDSHGKYPELIDGFDATKIDNYADSMLLNVIYNVDEKHPFYSVVTAPYYRVEGDTAAEDYHASVVDGKEANNEYSRYWHGSQVFLRPLLTVFSITGLRAVMFAVLAVLNILFGIMMLRRKLLKPALIYFASLILVGGWMTALSLEYVMTFIVMTAACMAVCRLMTDGESIQKRDERLTFVFVIGGVLTCFLDFLTTETLAFTVPFLLFIIISVQKSDRPLRFKENFLRLIRFGSAWLMSYAGMFAVKWGLVYFVAGKDAFLNALQSAAYRIDGVATAGETTFNLSQKIMIALSQNISCLLPTTKQLTAISNVGILVAAFLVLAVVLYLFRGERLDGAFIALMLTVACIPYLRYAVLLNHSTMHYFFTYRAQAATVMAYIAILAYQLNPSYVLHGGKNKNKNGKKKAKSRRR